MNTGSFECDELFYLNLESYMILNYRFFIFFHCPWTEKIEQSILLAKSLNKKVLYDIDDFIFDTKYTDQIKYIKNISLNEKKIYDEEIIKIGKTLKLCDSVITTTEVIANELKNYVNNIFINRNVASEEMWKLSQDALINRINITNNQNIIIGYFSESVTYSEDLYIIEPVLKKILSEFKNVKLLLISKIKISNFLIDFSERIVQQNYTDWRKLPEIISNVDINIIPLEKNIFNEGKSENKWLEASLVKVPTIASNLGAFKQILIHNETGFLCSDNNEWYISLKELITNDYLRKIVGENAFNFCIEKYNTIYTGRYLVNYINSFVNRHIGFFLPSLQIAGGIYVVLKHAYILKDVGWDVDIILPEVSFNLFNFQGNNFNIIDLNNTIMMVQFDIIVATLYTTLFTILNYYKSKKHLYLVQGYETDFYTFGNYFRSIAERTYITNYAIEYITVSQWCKNWIFQKYNKKARYAPNGIDLDKFISHKRKLNENKIRILIEGDCSSHIKNVDESFKIIEKLEKNKFEVWYLSNNGEPKDWYRVDKFLKEVHHENVSKIYEQCDILIKSSSLESFSYPPLEMMATGGYSIVAINGGNVEYLKDGENCLLYKLGEINDAVRRIENLILDEKLQQHLYENGLKTAKNRNWKNLINQVKSLYDS